MVVCHSVVVIDFRLNIWVHFASQFLCVLHSLFRSFGNDFNSHSYQYICVQSLSCSHSEALWPVACQAPLSMEFSRQEYWSGFPFPSPGDLPDPGFESASLVSPALAGGFFTIVPLCGAREMLCSYSIAK